MDLDTLLEPYEERYERIKQLSAEDRKRLYLMIGDVEESVGIEHLVDCLAEKTSMAGDGILRCYVGFEPSGKAHIGWKFSLQLKGCLTQMLTYSFSSPIGTLGSTTSLEAIWKIFNKRQCTWKRLSVPFSTIQKKAMDLDNSDFTGQVLMDSGDYWLMLCVVRKVLRYLWFAKHSP